MTFIENYMIYASGNEAASIFHEWGALSVLSAVVSKKVFFDQDYFKVYPNLYVVFVGEPGDKKTTALVIARTMAQKLGVPIAPPSITKEAITQLMSSENEKTPCRRNYTIGTFPYTITQLSFFASEITTLLEAGQNPAGLITFFTDIYDSEAFTVQTKNKGTDIIDSPYITILACMTPEQTGQLLKEKLITGGFSRRCIFLFGRGKAEGIPFPKLTDVQREAHKTCLSYLNEVKNMKGQYTIDDDASDFFRLWYASKHKQLRMPHSAVYKNWLRSKDSMLLRTAMLLDISDGFTKRITLTNLQRGLSALDATEKDLGRILAGAGKNPLAELAFKVLCKLEESPTKRLSKKQLLAVMFEDGNLEDIDKSIAFLVQTDQVKRSLTAGPNPVEVLEALTPKPQEPAAARG